MGVMVIRMSLLVQVWPMDSQVGGSLKKFEKHGVGQACCEGTLRRSLQGPGLSPSSASCSVTNLSCDLGQVAGLL